jgi:hypothetical protein
MEKNLKVVLSAVALAALVAAPAVAKSRTQQYTEHSAPGVAYGNSTVTCQARGSAPTPIRGFALSCVAMAVLLGRPNKSPFPHLPDRTEG